MTFHSFWLAAYCTQGANHLHNPHGKMDKVKTKEMSSSGEESSHSQLAVKGIYKHIKVPEDSVWLMGQSVM